jgi:hypothetical protein
MNSILVDQYLFYSYFELFKKFVKYKSKVTFVSFNSNPYTEQQEGYKSDIHKQARKLLNFGNWKSKDIGTGKIINAVIKSIELNDNNLVRWQARYGDKSRPHHKLYTSIHIPTDRRNIEKLFFDFYRQNIPDDKVFASLVKFFGKKYSLIAYLFFLKDKNKFMPIAPEYFDESFKKLSINHTTSHKCSWENYSQFNNILNQIKELLILELGTEVTLLDAHSFLWMLSSQMEGYKIKGPLKKIKNYKGLSSKDKESVIKARIGQGIFRVNVIDYWLHCALTGCSQLDVLVASHIKPWKELIKRGKSLFQKS